MRSVLLLMMLLTSCVFTEKELYQVGDIPDKPENGYNRFDFESYDKNMNERYISARGDNWVAQESNFKTLYPGFQVELIAINQSEGKEFSWEERLVFADALDWIVFVINHPTFIEEMKEREESEPFYNNERTQRLSAEEVVEKLRSSKFYFYLAKDDLGTGVFASATVTGYNNTVWFRSDTDYATQGVIRTAEILFHELTHNLGWEHSSKVPCGVQIPFFATSLASSQEYVEQFARNTPYYENDFLTKVRTLESAYTINQEKIQEDREEDLTHEI